MPCPGTQHLNNVPRLRGEKHDISPKILHQYKWDSEPHGRQRHRQRWQCVRLVPSAEMAASAVCFKKGVEMVQ